MYKLFFTIALFYCCISKTHAQNQRFEYSDSTLLNGSQTATEDTTTSYDTAEEDVVIDILSDTTLYIERINISPDSITNFKNDKRFAYIKNLDSLLRKKQQKEQGADTNSGTEQSISFLQRLLSSQFIKVFFWTIALIFVFVIVYKLFLSNGIFKRNTVSSPVNILPEEEQLPATVADYDRLILQSCKQENYRLAVRYLFLKNLAQLAEKEYLQLFGDKTNYQYAQEIRADKRNEFSSLLLTYEYIWYGNFAVNKETYAGIEKKYSSFYDKI